MIMDWEVWRSVISKLETRRADGVNSNLKASRLKTQEKPVFIFKSKDRRPMSQLKVARWEELPLTRGGVSLLFYSSP